LSKILKLIEKMLRLPAEMRFEDVVKVLEFFGWNLENVNGSHFVYYKEGFLPLTVVRHKNRVKRECIRKIIGILNLEEWYEEREK